MSTAEKSLSRQLKIDYKHGVLCKTSFLNNPPPQKTDVSDLKTYKS